MDGIFVVIGFCLAIFMLICIVRIPIIIAKSRGVTGENLSLIKVLSWLSILIPIVWFIGLIMSLVCKTGKQKENPRHLSSSEKLSELAKFTELRDKGIITEEEYEDKKQQLLL